MSLELFAQQAESRHLNFNLNSVSECGSSQAANMLVADTSKSLFF